MGTDGGSEADTGRGTHRRSRLPTPHLAPLAPPQLTTTAEKKRKFWQIWAVFGRLSWPRRSGGRPDVSRAVAGRYHRARALIAQ